MKIQVKTNFEKSAIGGSQLGTFLFSSLFLLAGMLIVVCVVGNAAALPPSPQIKEIWEVLDKASAELASITEEDFPQGQFHDGWPLGFWKLTEFKKIAAFKERVRDGKGLRRTAKRAEKGSEGIRMWHDGIWLAWIAKHQVQAGDQDGAIDTVHEALKRASKHGIENFPDRWLEDIIEVQALAGEAELAFQTTQWLEEPKEKALSLSRVAFALAQKNKSSTKVNDLFQEGIQESKKIKDTTTRVRVLLRIAQLQNDAGMLGEARKTIAFAGATIGASVKEDKKTVGSLGYLALLQMKYGDTEEGKETLRETIRRAEALPKKADAAIVLQNLAWRQIQNGDKGGARRTLEHARQVVQEIGDRDVRAQRLAIIGQFFGLAGEAVLAKKILFEVFDYLTNRPVQEELFENLSNAVYSLLALPNLTNNEIARIQKVVLGLLREDAQNASILYQLVEVQVRAGEITNAEHTREAILDNERRAEAAQIIGVAKVRFGNVEDSLRWVSSLDHPYSRTRALLGVAQGLMGKSR